MDLLLLLTSLWAIVHATPFQIQPLDPQKGILLEPLGVGITYEKTWTVLTTVKLPELEPVLEYLRYCDTTLLEICSLRGEASESKCNYWHRIIKRDIKDVEEQVAELRGYSSRTRKRRGLVNIVGKVSKFLFGTMDNDDSKQIYKRIQQLEQDGTESFELISKQMSLIKSNFDAVIEPIKEIRKEQDNLQAMVNHLVSEYVENLSKVEQEMRSMRVQGETTEIMLAVLTHMQSTQKILTNLFTLINALQQHKMHPLLLRANILEDLYKNITMKIGINSRLKDPALLSKIIKVDHLLLTDRLLVKISIPLGKETEYNLTRIHKYPILSEHGHFAILKIIPEYALVNHRANIVRTLTKEVFMQTCSRLQAYSQETIYICKEREPKPIGSQAQEKCVDLLVRKDNITNPHCPAQVLAYAPQLLVKMEAANCWLFSCYPEKILQTHCQNGTEQTVVQGTGILRLNPKCSYTLGAWELPVEDTETFRINDTKIGDTPVPKLIFNMEPMVNITTRLKPLNLSESNTLETLDSAAKRTIDLAN